MRSPLILWSLSWLAATLVQAAPPPVLDAAVATAGAPLAESADHGAIGQNVRVVWWRLAPGSDGPALYGAGEPVRLEEDGQVEETPLVFRLELTTGRLVEHVARGKLVELPADAAADLDLEGALDDAPAKAPEPLSTGWTWERPLWAAGAGDRVLIGSSTGWVLRYYPRQSAFQRAFQMPRGSVATAAVMIEDTLYLLDRDNRVYARDSLGLDLLGPLDTANLPAGPRAAIVAALRQEPCPDTASLPGIEVGVDFAVDPPVTVRQPGEPARQLPVVFAGAAWDRGKSLTVGPDGKTIYGAGWPTAWIYEYHPDSGILRRRGRDYVWYAQIPSGNEIYVIGYYGIKLMRWTPALPWTFDEATHYANKQPWPGHASPFGARDSNPRLVARFRYLRQLNIRRPSGFALGADGRFYCGAKNAAHMFYLETTPDSFAGTRYCGALCWYDPATETIGTERAPFLHHECTDTAAIADRRYIALTAKAAGNPFDPLPDPFPRSKLVLWDTRTHQFVQEEDLTGGKLWYVEEAAPGHAVVASDPGRYAADGVRSVLAVYDVHARRVERVIRLPVQIVWNQYDASDKFQRGPDQCLYFYGTDDAGTAMFRFDSHTGRVTPVWREPQVSDFATYIVKGPPFCFAADRVYLATTHLRSLPLTTIVGPQP